MAIKTYEQQLEEVQAAIEVIESAGQSYSMGNRTYTSADLATLYKREERLLAKVARESRGGMLIQYGMPE